MLNLQKSPKKCQTETGFEKSCRQDHGDRDDGCGKACPSKDERVDSKKNANRIITCLAITLLFQSFTAPATAWMKRGYRICPRNVDFTGD